MPANSREPALVLAVDTATPAVSAALVRVGAADGGQPMTVLARRQSVDAMAHAERLAPAIVEVLAEAACAPADLTAIVAGLGPGPFTGLRVGLVTATALAQALGIPAYGVCTLDALGAATSGLTLVATDARRREVYWALYRDGVRVGEPAVDRPAAVVERLDQLGVKPTAAVGEGALCYAEVLGIPAGAGSAYPELIYPDLAVLVEGALARIVAGAPDELLTPLYLRRPDVAEPVARKAVLT